MPKGMKSEQTHHSLNKGGCDENHQKIIIIIARKEQGKLYRLIHHTILTLETVRQKYFSNLLINILLIPQI